MVDVDAVAAELYGLRPEEFTAARDAHAAAARKAGQRAEAKRIAALRRPTLAVWAANRLARADADQAQHLLEIGQGLREAHRTLSGEDLRKLSHHQHVVIAAMAGEARRLAGEAGQDLSPGAQHEVEQILRGVLADPDAAEAWARGVLAKAPPRAVGFAEVAPEPGTAPRPQQHEPKPARKPKPTREPKPEPKPEPEPEREPKPEPEPARKPKPVSEPEPGREPKPVPEPKPKPAADTKEAERASREAERAEEALARAETERAQARTGLGALDEEIGRLEERLSRARAERERLAATAEDADRRHREAAREAKAARAEARAAARKARRR
ncbi:hypothetical protein [Streptomyces sp. NRRL F-4474]|uniref:hypothetical protein n=1 Tax=Streptomyces sp. NRRL F-4474 TaxID=1463851 RepID=UPI0004CB1013|nr:hypothetical protein [Streptomyces sp. NRRL F-4474]